jgi:hypothetical protein
VQAGSASASIKMMAINARINLLLNNLVTYASFCFFSIGTHPSGDPVKPHQPAHRAARERASFPLEL